MKAMHRLLLLILLVGCSSTPPAPAPSFWAGVAVVDLTPDKPTPLGGYMARLGQPFKGVHDPVYAKALWLETADTRVCLVTTDLIGSSREIRDRIKPPDAHVVLAASHTHSGPGALAKGFWELAMGPHDPEFYEETVRRLKSAVDRARAARRPAALAFARGEAPGLSRNRRSKEGPVDPELHLMRVSDAQGRPLAVVANFTAHPTVLPEKSMLLSADWPGVFQRELERHVGAPVLFTNGAEGDQAPSAPEGRDPWERMASLGRALAVRSAALLDGIEKSTSQATITYVERGVDLPSPTLRVAPTTSVLGLLTINGVRIFLFPGEPIVELGLALKRRFPGSWVVGLANDHLGYFLSDAEYARGGYEKTVSFYGPSMGRWLVERLAELGEGDHASDRAGEPEGRRGKDHDRGQPQ